MSTGEFMKEMRRIFWSHRQFNGDQQLLRLERGFVDPDEKLACRNPPLAAWPASNDGSAKREHAGRQFGSRVCVRKAPPNGAAVADCRMGNMGDRIRQQGSMVAISGDFRRSAWRVNAPMVRRPPSTSTPRNSANSPM